MNRLKEFGALPIILAAVLLFQLSFQAIHALNEHTEDTLTAHSSYDTLVDEAASTCASCLHFLSNQLYIEPLIFLLAGLIISFFSKMSEVLFPSTETVTLYLLRGPPRPRD